MRIRPAILLIFAAVLPLAHVAAQTCQGVASFEDGKARVGADYSNGDDSDLIRAYGLYGVDRSWYGGINANERQFSNGAASRAGVGGTVGYQIHVQETPFQVCPEVTANVESGGGASATVLGLGGSVGYRLFIGPGLRVIPAAGIRVLSSNDPLPGRTSTTSEVFMALGFVIRKSFTVVPTVRVPSTKGAGDIAGIGVAFNWGK